MSFNREILLAELLTAKFSHDLAGTISAAHNGVEFLSEEDFDMKEQAISLISNSTQESVARLKFFRVAYGVTKETGEANLDQLKVIMQNYFSFGKCTLNWERELIDDSKFFIDQRFSKLLINLVIVAKSSVLVAGNVNVIIEHDGENKLTLNVTSEGKRIKIPDDHHLLTVEAPEQIELTTKNVQTYLTRKLIDAIDASITMSGDDNHFNMKVEYLQS